MRTTVFLVLFLPLCLTAQKEPGIPLLTLKTNVSALINPIKQAYAFAADLRLSSKMSADAGAGAFLGSALQFAQREGESYTGLRLRAGLKYYMIQRERYAFHVGMQSKYHDIKHITFRQVLRQGQQYLEILPVERTLKTYGMAGRSGWQFYLGRNNRLLLEPYFGFGIAWHDARRNLPPDAELIDEGGFLSFEYEQGKSVMPDILMGVYLGVALW